LEDFNALAMSLGAGMADVRGCLILSSDGLVLGAHPAEAERATTPAWVRFAAIGDPERASRSSARRPCAPSTEARTRGSRSPGPA
jgi:hypothetical protein